MTTRQLTRGRPQRAVVVPARPGRAHGRLAQPQLQFRPRPVSYHHQFEQSKSDFISLASHQLRTPISAIAWLAELLVHGDAGPLTEEQRDHVEQIYASSQRLANIVDDMLLISNMELGTLQLNPQPLDLAGLSSVMLQMQLQLVKGNKNLQIRKQYASGLPQITIDPDAVRTLLRHLLSNAVKYTPDGGSITLSLKRSDVKLTPASSGSLELTVADTGYGIPAHEQPQVFHKLFRASNIRDKDTDGTGLGLFIVKELLARLGGRISFTSRQDQGSSFTIVLPLTLQPNEGGQHA